MNTKFIRTLVHNFNCKRAFSTLIINERVSAFNKTNLIIASNYIPQETVMCDDREILE